VRFPSMHSASCEKLFCDGWSESTCNSRRTLDELFCLSTPQNSRGARVLQSCRSTATSAFERDVWLTRGASSRTDLTNRILDKAISRRSRRIVHVETIFDVGLMLTDDQSDGRASPSGRTRD